MSADPKSLPPTDPLFESILSAPDRDRCPLTREVISYQDSDETRFLQAIESAAVNSVSLERRGAYHGEWAVLEPSLLPPRANDADETLDDARYEAMLVDRWHACRPIVLPGITRPFLSDFAADIGARDALVEDLAQPGGLRRFLTERAAELEPGFRVLQKRAPLFDRERDIERVLLESFAPSGRGKTIEDLWLKSAWLSTYDADASLRLRFSFGSERDDDASRDIVRQRVIGELAERLLPETAVVTGHPALVPLLEKMCGEPVLFTQHIAYWNARSGGALFHHDGFAEDAWLDGSWRQLGVAYAQLSGSTAWLALSIEDLVLRVREFVEALSEGEMPWVKAQLCHGARAPIGIGFERLVELVHDDSAARNELALPGQGVLGALVNRGPEFTSFLADAGHAHVLEAGDVILLPNRGLFSTCMHSVFCAGEETGYSLSLAMRPNREAPEELESKTARGRTAARSREHD